MMITTPGITTSVCELIRRKALKVAGMVLMISAFLASPQGGCATYTGSVQIATGDYIFSDRTTSFYFHNGIRFSAGPLSISTNIPMVYQSSPWVSYSGAGMIPSGGTQHSQIGGRKHGDKMALVDTVQYDQVGLGDPSLHLDVELLRERRTVPSLHLTADLKAPLADMNSGFGTGEWDYSAGFSLAKTVGRSFVFVDVAYWVLGDLPDLVLHDAVAYGIAFGRPLAAGKYAVLISLSGYSRILEDTDPPAQVGIAISHRLSSSVSLSGNVALGVTESTPDVSASLGWQIGL